MTLSTIKNPTKERKASVDCHVLVRWSELEKLVKEIMSCVGRGLAVAPFEWRTVRITTEGYFFCSTCNLSEAAAALWSGSVVE
jgi:hypothetical protein